MDRQVRQHFAIDLDIRLLETMNKLTIVQIIQARGGIDARNPEPSEIALAIPAVAEGVEERLQHRFIRAAEEPMFRAELAFGKF